jgi:hypothetical protein
MPDVALAKSGACPPKLQRRWSLSAEASAKVEKISQIWFGQGVYEKAFIVNFGGQK